MTIQPQFSRFAFALMTILIVFFPEFSSGTTFDRILATIDDQVITFADYTLFLRDVTDSQSGDGIDDKILRQLIEEKLIALEAKRRKLIVPDEDVEKTIEEYKIQNNMTGDELAAFLKEDGIDLEKFRSLVRERIFISQLFSTDVEAKVLITDQEVGEFYLTHRQEFLDSPEYVELNAIYLLLRPGSSLTEITDMKRRALKIAALLQGGEHFERLVDEYSDEPLRSHGGVLGKFTRGALIAPLDQKAFQMKEGETSDPIWVGDGVFILRLVKRTAETFKPLEEVKSSIRDILYRQKREKIYNDWIKALWEKSSVRIQKN